MTSTDHMTYPALLNEKFKGVHSEYIALINSLVGLHARLTEDGEDGIADDLRNIWLASLDRMNSEVFVDPKELN